jgi:hypothetical protein
MYLVGPKDLPCINVDNFRPGVGDRNSTATQDGSLGRLEVGDGRRFCHAES